MKSTTTRRRATWTAAAALLPLLVLMTVGCSDDGRSTSQLKSADYLINARAALDSGDDAAAMEALNASLESSPNVWAYLERAKLKAKQGDVAGAEADAKAGLELDPGNVDFVWIQTEVAKPEKDRFKGGFEPPSFNK